MEIIGGIETAIIQRLRSGITDVPVDGRQDKAGEYALKSPSGAVFVGYAGARFKEPEASGMMVQEAEVDFSVAVFVRHYAGRHSGAYAYLDAARALLTGFAAPGCITKMYPVSEEFEGMENGIFKYEQLYRMKTMHIELVEAEVLPLLKRLTLDSPYGQEIVE